MKTYFDASGNYLGSYDGADEDSPFTGTAIDGFFDGNYKLVDGVPVEIISELEKIIVAKQAAVNTSRDTKLNAGITFNGKTWKADKISGGGMAEKSDRYTDLNAVTARVITGATQANPVVVSYTGDPIPDGELVQITAIAGMTELNGNNYRFKNGGTGTAELHEASGVGYVPVDGTAFTAYTSGGLGNIFVCWIAEDNTVARLSFADFKLLRRHVNTYLSSCIEAARKHKNAIAELADVAAVDAYDITTDWPSSTF